MDVVNVVYYGETERYGMNVLRYTNIPIPASVFPMSPTGFELDGSHSPKPVFLNRVDAELFPAEKGRGRHGHLRVHLEPKDNYYWTDFVLRRTVLERVRKASRGGTFFAPVLDRGSCVFRST